MESRANKNPRRAEIAVLTTAIMLVAVIIAGSIAYQKLLRKNIPYTNYNYTSFEAAPEDQIDVYVKGRLLGRCPFKMSAETLSTHVNKAFGLSIQPVKDRFFISPGFKRIGGTFEAEPHYIYVDGHPGYMFTIKSKGKVVPVRIKATLRGSDDPYRKTTWRDPYRPANYEFRIVPIAARKS